MKPVLASVQRSAFMQLALVWLLCVALSVGLALWFAHPEEAPIAEVFP